MMHMVALFITLAICTLNVQTTSTKHGCSALYGWLKSLGISKPGNTTSATQSFSEAASLSRHVSRTHIVHDSNKSDVISEIPTQITTNPCDGLVIPGSPASMSVSGFNRVMPFTLSLSSKQQNIMSPLNSPPIFGLDPFSEGISPKSLAVHRKNRVTNSLHANPLTLTSRPITGTKTFALRKQIICSFLSNTSSKFVYLTESGRLHCQELNLMPELFGSTILGHIISTFTFFRAIYSMNANVKKFPHLYANNHKMLINCTEKIIQLAKLGYFKYQHPSVTDDYNRNIGALELIQTYSKILPLLKFKNLSENSYFNESNLIYNQRWEQITSIDVPLFAGVLRPSIAAQDLIVRYSETVDLQYLKRNYFLDVYNFDTLSEHFNVKISYETQLFADKQLQNNELNVVPLRLISTIHHISAVHAIQRNAFMINDTLNIKYGLEHGYDVIKNELFYIVSVSDNGKSIYDNSDINKLKENIGCLFDGCQKQIRFANQLQTTDSVDNIDDLIRYPHQLENNKYENQLAKYLESTDDNVQRISMDEQGVMSNITDSYIHLHSLELASLVGFVQRYAIYHYKQNGYSDFKVDSLCGFKFGEKMANTFFCQLPIAVLREPLLNHVKETVSYPTR